MPVIHPNTLFHFTKKLTNLQSILQNGLRFSYCFEEFGDGNGIALPMVCFCDIPLLRTPQHRKRYGNYMIGLTKDFFRQDTTFKLNPVMYRYSYIIKPARLEALPEQMDNLSKAYKKDIQQYIDENDIKDTQERLNKDPYIYAKTTQNIIETAYLLYSYAFSKLYATEKDSKTINNFDECEWRYVYRYSHNNKAIWKLDIDASKFEVDKQKLNKRLWEKDDSRIIPNKDICKSISFIVVRTDKQIESMIKFIRKTKNIFGNRITPEEKDILISKITSFESIETNY